LEKINATTYSVTASSGDSIELGDLRASSFKPHARLKRWDGECCLGVGLKTSSEKQPTIEGERLNWQDDKTGVSLYVLEPDEQNELGGFEFEVTLKDKPEANVLEFDIETEGLKFYYQPELTAEKIAEGAFRPDNTVGSYAVYHATRGNMHSSQETAEKYKTGKAFHIYRPKVTDNGGKWVWGELHIDEKAGKLTITIDQQWLDNAEYPVIVDPTFGYTSAGSGTEYIDTFGPWRSKHTMGANDGTGVSISAYLRNKENDTDQYYKFAIYQGNSVIANGVTNEGIVPFGEASPSWRTQNFPTGPSLAASTEYYLAAAGSQLGDEKSLYIYWDSGEANQTGRDTTDYGSVFPDPWSNNSQSAAVLSIYGTYEEGGGVTEKASSDSGSGADDEASNNPAATISDYESGSSAESKLSGNPAAMLKAGETGAGDEEKTGYPAGELTGLEVGEGGDTAVLMVVMMAAGESGSGIETSYLDITGYIAKVSSDSGNGIEADFVIVALIKGCETGSGAGALKNRAMALDESATGAELSITVVVWMAVDGGSGVEVSNVIPVFFSGDTGLGYEFSMAVKDIRGGDGGFSSEALKALIGTVNSGYDMRLHGRSGQVKKPSRRVRMPSKGVNI